MGKLKPSRRKSRSPQVGDMRDRVSLYARNIKAPVFGTANFTQLYTLIKEVWASIETLEGPVTFDDVDTTKSISIVFKIRYRSDVSTETVVQFNGFNYEIVEAHDADKRNRFLFLRCALMGDATLEVSQ